MRQDRELLLPEIQALWDRGQRVEAVDRLTQKFERDSGDHELGAKLIEWEVAIHRYQSAWTHLENQGPGSDRMRGKLLYLLGHYEQALPFLDSSDPDQCLARLDALEALGRNQELDAALDQAASVLGPEHPKVLTARGQVEARSGEFEQAVTHFRAALAGDPLNQAARFGLGRALVALGQREQGLLVLEEHRRLVPLIDRLEFARKSLDLAPAHAPNQADVGDCERALGLPQAALRSYRSAVRLAQPAELVPISLRLARLYFEDLKDSEQAQALLLRSFESVPDPRLLVRAGDYARTDGDHAAAEQHYRRALQLRPGDRAILKRLDDLLHDQAARD